MKAERQPHLVLYGQIAWRIGSLVEPVPSGRPTAVLAMLASKQPRWTPAANLIDEIWGNWPRSGENAVQRHISLLRSHLRRIGVKEQVIETSLDGYRLAPWVSTDLVAIEDALRNDDVNAEGSNLLSGPQWWAEPLPGLSKDLHGALRGSLTFRANQARKIWVSSALDSHKTAEAARLLGPMLVRNPDDTELLHLVADIAEASTDDGLVRDLQLALSTAVDRSETHDELLRERVHRLQQTLLPPAVPGYQKLDSVADDWLHNDLDRAFESLEERSGSFSRDVVRRVARCLTWISPDDPWARLMWSELVGLPPAMADLAERSLVSLDAFALEHNQESLRVCDQEVEETSNAAEHFRALRVRFMVGLGHPIDSKQIETVERIATIDDSMACIEALRFAGILSAKRGQFDQAQFQFERSVDLRRKTQPAVFEDFAHMASIVISMSEETTDDQDHPVLSTPPASFPLVSTHATIEMATLWKLLTRSKDSWRPESEGMMQRVLRATPPECCRAYRLLFELRSDQKLSRAVGEVGREAQSLFQSIEGLPSNRHRQATLFALSRYAISCPDPDMASKLHQRLLPWTGEQLGIWPLDVLIGPVDALLRQLEAVSD